MSEEKNTSRFHNIILENRSSLNVSGVDDVDSFDEHSITAFTQMGVLAVKGENLHINKFSVEVGELSIEGKICSIAYTDDFGGKSSGGFFSKMFR